jgi:hypothetical protein
MLDIVKEISVSQSDLIKSFAIFYLLLVGNYIGSSLFTCFQINYLKEHKMLQLVIAFFLFYFLVIIVSDTGNLEFTPPIEKFIYSLFYFFAFLLVMRLDMFITMMVLVLIFIIYFIELNKEFYLHRGSEIDNPLDQDIYNNNQFWITIDWPINVRLFKVKKEDFVIINKIERILYYIIIFLLVVGFISYSGEIRDTVKRSKNITWIDIFLDTNICKLTNRKEFLHYFKVGLGLNI